MGLPHEEHKWSNGELLGSAMQRSAVLSMQRRVFGLRTPSTLGGQGWCRSLVGHLPLVVGDEKGTV
jgi:hypothetical protein